MYFTRIFAARVTRSCTWEAQAAFFKGCALLTFLHDLWINQYAPEVLHPACRWPTACRRDEELNRASDLWRGQPDPSALYIVSKHVSNDVEAVVIAYRWAMFPLNTGCP